MAMSGSISALVTGPAGTLALLARARTRFIRVRPPLNLSSFMDQIALVHRAQDNAGTEQGFNFLTVPGDDYDQILLVVEEAHLLPEATLRYIEFALRAGPSLQVVLAGRAEAASPAALDDFASLRERLLLGPAPFASPASPPARPAVAAVHNARSSPREEQPSPALAPAAFSRRSGLTVAFASSLVTAGLIVATWLGGPVLAPFLNIAHVGSSTLQPDNSPDARVAARPASSVRPSVADLAARSPAPFTPPQVDPGTQVGPGADRVTSLQAAAPPATEVTAAQPVPASKPPMAPVPPPPAALEQAAADAQARPQALVATTAGTPSDMVTLSRVAQEQGSEPQAQPAVAAIAKPAMIALPGATFRMGSGDDRSERPAHPVVVRHFSIAEHATTLREWQECVHAGVCNPEPGEKPQNPVTNVSWDDARRYTEWLSGVTGQHYRLPTEAEWEYAARGGTTTRYAWGEAMLPGRSGCRGCGATTDLQNPPWVGAYPANAFALYGMGGGVAEWVADCWHRDYQGVPEDGSQPWGAPDCRTRVLRGGSWMEEAAAVRPASRESYDASVRYPTHGFRVALSE